LTELPQHYPYVPRKSEIEKKTKGKIREQISPPLDPATVSACGWDHLFQDCMSLGAWWFPANQAHTPTYNHITYLYY